MTGDYCLSGWYTVLSVEHVLSTCRSGLRWESEGRRPLLVVPPKPLSFAGIWYPLRAETLVIPRNRFLGMPICFNNGDARAFRALVRLVLLYKWTDANLPMVPDLAPEELSAALEDMPVEIRSVGHRLSYAVSLLQAHLYSMLCRLPIRGVSVGDLLLTAWLACRCCLEDHSWIALRDRLPGISAWSQRLCTSRCG